MGARLASGVGGGRGYALRRGLPPGGRGVESPPPFETMVAVAIAGLILGLVAAILPARRAARLDVIDAIGYE